MKLTDLFENIVTIKPRNKHVNDILVSKKGGSHKSPKDFDRQRLKQETRKETDKGN